MRRRLAEAHEAAAANPWEVKLGPGRMMDIELLAQAGALIHGPPASAARAGCSPGSAALGWIDRRRRRRARRLRSARLAALQQVGRLASDHTIDPAEGGDGLVRLVLAATGSPTSTPCAASLAAEAEDARTGSTWPGPAPASAPARPPSQSRSPRRAPTSSPGRTTLPKILADASDMRRRLAKAREPVAGNPWEVWLGPGRMLDIELLARRRPGLHLTRADLCCRGDPARPRDQRAAGGVRGAGTARADAPARGAPRGSDDSATATSSSCRTRTGSLWEAGPDRGGADAQRPRLRDPQRWPLPAAGGDRLASTAPRRASRKPTGPRSPRSTMSCSRGALAGRGVELGDRGRHAGWPGSRPRIDRPPPERKPGALFRRACRARRLSPPARAEHRSGRRLRTRACSAAHANPAAAKRRGRYAARVLALLNEPASADAARRSHMTSSCSRTRLPTRETRPNGAGVWLPTDRGPTDRDAAHRLPPRLPGAAPPRPPLPDVEIRLPARGAGRAPPAAARRRLPRAGAALASPAPPRCTRSPTSSAWRTRRLTPAEERAIGLPNTAAVARRAFLAAAGTLLAARLALEHGIACNMAGGSHHAGPEGGAGYCVFNDVAIAAQALLDEGRVARVLVVDCDVHQGDGTARIFAGRADVLTLSLHAERNYPARKAASHLDYPLPDRLADRAYLEVLAHALAADRGLPPRHRLLQRRRRPARGRPPRPPRPHRRRPPRPRRPGHSAGRAAAACRWPASSAAATTTSPKRLAARHAILFEEAARAAA